MSHARTAAHVLAAAVMIGLIYGGVRDGVPQPELHDFRSIMASGAAAHQGRNPYAVYPLSARVELLGLDKRNPNFNPPISVLIFQACTPLQVQPDWPAPIDPVMFRMLRRWWACYAICLALLLFLLHARYEPGAMRLLWVLALAGLWDTFMLGSPYIPLALLVAAAWVALDSDRPILAGLLAGCVIAVKVNLLVWPVLMLMGRHRRFAAAAFASAICVSAIPLLVYGPQIYSQWWALVSGLDAGRTGFPTNASLIGLGVRFGHPRAAMVGAAALLVGLATWAVLRRPGPMRLSALALVAALLASPIAWVHYALFLLPVYYAYRRWDALMWTSAALWLFPVLSGNIAWMGEDPAWMHWTGGSLYNWALVLLFLSLLRRSR